VELSPPLCTKNEPGDVRIRVDATLPKDPHFPSDLFRNKNEKTRGGSRRLKYAPACPRLLGRTTRTVPGAVEIPLIGKLRVGIRPLSLFYQVQETANDLVFGAAWFERGSRDLIADLSE